MLISKFWAKKDDTSNTLDKKNTWNDTPDIEWIKATLHKLPLTNVKLFISGGHWSSNWNEQKKQKTSILINKCFTLTLYT